MYKTVLESLSSILKEWSELVNRIIYYSA